MAIAAKPILLAALRRAEPTTLGKSITRRLFRNGRRGSANNPEAEPVSASFNRFGCNSPAASSTGYATEQMCEWMRFKSRSTSRCNELVSMLSGLPSRRRAANRTHRIGSLVIAASTTRTLGAFSAGASVSIRMCNESSIRPKPIATRLRSRVIVRPPKLNASKPARNKTGASAETSNDSA